MKDKNCFLGYQMIRIRVPRCGFIYVPIGPSTFLRCFQKHHSCSILSQNLKEHQLTASFPISKFMDKFKKSQILKLLVIITLLSITPLVSESLRSPYLYFVVNLLIIALGAEAGLLSFTAAEEEEVTAVAARKPLIPTEEALRKEESPPAAVNVVLEPQPAKKKPTHVVEKSHSEKIVTGVKVNKAVKKSPSTPSLFFIGCGDTEAEEFVEDNDQDQEEVGDLTRQELFHKAETFIGNFYRQLKMQREESWKKIHGLYQKAF